MRKQELHPRTAIVNQKQKHGSKVARQEALKWLATKFPNAFDNSVQIRPLKRGILQDVLSFTEEAAKDGISKSKLREAVVVFARRIDYLTTLKAREKRINLDGEPVSEVTEEEADKAAAKIKRRIEKSVKSARKVQPAKPSTSNGKMTYPTTYEINSSSSTYYSNSAADSDIEPASFKPKPVKSPSVMVKHKSAKQYDPEAVARLKEKLGLSRKEETVD